MTVVLPHVFATLPATPPTPARYFDDNFNALLTGVNASGLPYVNILSYGTAGQANNGTTDWTAARNAALATGMSVYYPRGEYGYDPTLAGTPNLAPGQIEFGDGPDISRIVKWGNGALVNLQGDGCGTDRITYVGQFQRAALIAAGYLSASSPSIADTTDCWQQGATSVGVTNSPNDAFATNTRCRGAGRDGFNWMEGSTPRWFSLVASGCARWGYNGTGTSIDRTGLVSLDMEAAANGNGTQAGGGGFNVTCGDAVVGHAKAYENFGPGFAIQNLGGGGGDGQSCRWKIYDEGNGLSNASAPVWASSTSYAALAVVQATWTISTTGSGTQNFNTLTVASGTNIPNGAALTIAGAGPGSDNLTTMVIAGGGTTALTLETPIGTTVAGVAVTGNGYGLFVATGSGTSGSTKPTWVVGTNSDGGVTWQARNGNGIEMLQGRQSEFDAVFTNGLNNVVSTSYAGGHFNTLKGLVEANVWFNAEILRAVQSLRISQFARYGDPTFSGSDATMGNAFQIEMPVRGQTTLVRAYFPINGILTAGTSSGSLVFGDAAGQQEPISNIANRISGPTHASGRIGGNLTNIKVGARVYSGGVVTSSVDFNTFGLGGGSVDASEFNTLIMDATSGNLTCNIRAGGTGAAPGDWIEIINLATNTNSVTVSGTGYYIIAGGLNTLVAVGSIVLTNLACSVKLHLKSLTLGTGSTPLWVKAT